MTPNKEDYLKLIFELGGDKQMINNKQIVSGLNVSAASVSEMIPKLVKEGFAKHSPYQGVQLTAAGLEKASMLIRKHRLWEVFLVQYLGYTWNEVHDEAEVLEHVTSSELSNRLEQFLKYPENCPHGGAIPRDSQTIQELPLKPLLAYDEGVKIRIERVLDEPELLNYLVSLGIQIHDEWVIDTISAYEGPITLKNDNRSLSISYKAAGNVFVNQI